MTPGPSGSAGSQRGGRNLESPMDTVANFPNVGERCLEVLCPAMVTEEQMHRLFDIVPGLDYCNLDKNAGKAEIQISCSHAHTNQGELL